MNHVRALWQRRPLRIAAIVLVVVVHRIPRCPDAPDRQRVRDGAVLAVCLWPVGAALRDRHPRWRQGAPGTRDL